MSATIRLVDGEFHKGDKPLGVRAIQKRGRWSFRATDGTPGRLIASGGTPAEFVAAFWFAELDGVSA